MSQAAVRRVDTILSHLAVRESLWGMAKLGSISPFFVAKIIPRLDGAFISFNGFLKLVFTQINLGKPEDSDNTIIVNCADRSSSLQQPSAQAFGLEAQPTHNDGFAQRADSRASTPLQSKAVTTGAELRSFQGSTNLWLLDGKAQGSISFGMRTIPEGCAVAVSNLFGQTSIVEGPAWRLFFNENFQVLPRFVAGPSDYLSIQFKDGHTENVPGPKTLFFNPKEHESISVHAAVNVYAGYAIVVYEKNEKSNAVTRTVVKGPTLYQMRENQWLHNFFWWIPDQKNPSHRSRQLQRLKMVRLIPDHLYYNVEDVRTNDDAVVTIRLIIFFHLSNIEKMLDNTHDPPTDILTHVTADVIDFVCSRNFDKFKEDTEELNLLKTYKQTLNRVATIGYEIQKVVYRGYAASEKLQQMHNSAIEARTALKLKSETEAQSEQIEDMKQGRRHDREALAMDHDSKAQAHKHALELAEQQAKTKRLAEEHSAQLDRAKQDHDARLLRERLEHEAELKKRQAITTSDLEADKRQLESRVQHEQQLNTERLHYLTALKSQAGVDVSAFLASGNYPTQKQADKVIQISGSPAKFHMHDQSN